MFAMLIYSYIYDTNFCELESFAGSKRVSCNQYLDGVLIEYAKK